MFEHLIEHGNLSSQRPKVSQRNMATRDPTSATPSTMPRMTMTDTPVQIVPAYGPDESSTLDDLSSGASINDIDIDPNYNPSEMISFDSDSGMIAQPGSFDFDHYTAPERDISLKGAQKEQAPLQLDDTQFRDMPAFNDDGTLHKKPFESPTAPQSSSSGPRTRIYQKPFVQNPRYSPAPQSASPTYLNAPSMSPVYEEYRDLQNLDDFLEEFSAPGAEFVTDGKDHKTKLAEVKGAGQKLSGEEDRLAREISDIHQTTSRTQAMLMTVGSSVHDHKRATRSDSSGTLAAFRKLDAGQNCLTELVREMQDKLNTIEEKSKAKSEANPSTEKSDSPAAAVDSKAPLSPKLEKMLADYFGVTDKKEEDTTHDEAKPASASTQEANTTTEQLNVSPPSVDEGHQEINACWTRAECFTGGMVAGIVTITLGILMGTVGFISIPGLILLLYLILWAYGLTMLLGYLENMG